MNILSLFDGISCGRLALERAGIKVDSYFASEIDKYAIQIAKKNYPDTIHIWSVTDVFYENWILASHDWVHNFVNNWKIDLLIWWSPCQDLSIAKKWGKGLQWEKSSLFFEYVRLLKEVKPNYFLLENVASMKKADKEEITRILTEIYPDTQCYAINSALVSAQQRRRLYWSNIQWVTQPEDKGILLKDILEDNVDEKYTISEKHTIAMRESRNSKKLNIPEIEWKSSCITASYYKIPNDAPYISTIRVWQFNSGGQWDRVYSTEWKSVSLSANGGGRGAKTGLYEVCRATVQKNSEQYDNWKSPTLTSAMGMWWWNVPMCMSKEDSDRLKWIYIDWEERKTIRKLTPIEAERLQTLPDNWTQGVSNTQRYKAIWNGWTVDVIAHIFSFIK